MKKLKLNKSMLNKLMLIIDLTESYAWTKLKAIKSFYFQYGGGGQRKQKRTYKPISLNLAPFFFDFLFQ